MSATMSATMHVSNHVMLPRGRQRQGGALTKRSLIDVRSPNSKAEKVAVLMLPRARGTMPSG